MDENVVRELSKIRSSSKKDLIFQHVITGSREKSLLTAYKVKREINQITPPSPSHIKIVSTEPLHQQPEGKFTHLPGARISSTTLTRSQINVSLEVGHVKLSYIELCPSFIFQLLKAESPEKRSIANCKPAPVHLRLSSMDNWPETYKQRFFENGGTHAGGDIADEPKGVINLLSGTSVGQLNIPGRAADYLSEVQWRMQLRN